jgi:hypothetical protein
VACFNKHHISPIGPPASMKTLAPTEVMGSNPPGGYNNCFSRHRKNSGCHVVPSDWATCHLVIGSYHTVTITINIQSVCHVITVQPSQLPRQLPYNPFICHITYHTSMCHATSSSVHPCHLPRQHSNNLAVVRTTTCQPAIGPHHVWTTMCHSYSAMCQIRTGANSTRKCRF